MDIIATEVVSGVLLEGARRQVFPKLRCTFYSRQMRERR